MINVILNGAAGRMGQTLIRLTTLDPALKLVGAIELANNVNVGRDAGCLIGQKEIGVKISSRISDVIPFGDVVIDFSSPEATIQLVETVRMAKKALVIGTTGHTSHQKSILSAAGEEIPVLISPNMSVGVNLIWALAELAAKVLRRDYRVEIVETHHIHKKDAPSGTAKRLLEIVTKASGPDINRDVSVQSFREGEVVGNHTVSFTGSGDRLEITHEAFNRDIFAIGALTAAKWIVDKKAGLYNMKDVLFSV